MWQFTWDISTIALALVVSLQEVSLGDTEWEQVVLSVEYLYEILSWNMGMRRRAWQDEGRVRQPKAGKQQWSV